MPLNTPLTSFSGLPLIAEVFAFALMLVGGGERLDDFNRMREDALPVLLGYLPPSPDKARRFLYAFHDATIIESHNREALPHDKGGRGYQPSVVAWAEADLILQDEFRDGNVPAGLETLG